MNTAIANSLAARRANSEKDSSLEKQKGFTLIELLVVVVIIGILAAIAIPTFLNQRQAAWEAQVTSDISNASIAAETLAVSDGGSYSSITTTDALKNAGYRATPGVTITPAYTAASGSGATAVAAKYTLTVKHAKYTAPTWVYDSLTGVTTKTTP